MSNLNAPVSISNNVNIKCIKRGKVVRDSYIHNKATINLVEGILRFLRSEFTPSTYNSLEGSYIPPDAKSYIPTEVRFGHVGVLMKDRGGSSIDSNIITPTLTGVDYGQLKKPTFEEYKLQEEIAANRERFAMTKIKFETAEIVSFSDNNNSLALKLHAYIPPGQLVCLKDDTANIIDGYYHENKFYKTRTKVSGVYVYSNPFDDNSGRLYRDISNASVLDSFYRYSTDDHEYKVATDRDIRLLSRFYFTDNNVKDKDDEREGQGWVYYKGDPLNPIEGDGFEALFTEIGLFSSEGTLLARVAFDGACTVGNYSEVTFDDPANENNPVIQSEDSSIIVEWVIGITSVGQNDEIITGVDLRNLGMGTTLSSEDIRKMINNTDVESSTVSLMTQLDMLTTRYEEINDGRIFKVSDEYKDMLYKLLTGGSTDLSGRINNLITEIDYVSKEVPGELTLSEDSRNILNRLLTRTYVSGYLHENKFYKGRTGSSETGYTYNTPYDNDPEKLYYDVYDHKYYRYDSSSRKYEETDDV